jgi:hypothetical protein
VPVSMVMPVYEENENIIEDQLLPMWERSGQTDAEVLVIKDDKSWYSYIYWKNCWFRIDDLESLAYYREAKEIIEVVDIIQKHNDAIILEVNQLKIQLFGKPTYIV